jgi:hypothetical protein
VFACLIARARVLAREMACAHFLITCARACARRRRIRQSRFARQARQYARTTGREDASARPRESATARIGAS